MSAERGAPTEDAGQSKRKGFDMTTQTHQTGAIGNVATKIVTPIFYAIAAAFVAAFAMLIGGAEAGPVLWIVMAAFGLLAFISGVVKVRRG